MRVIILHPTLHYGYSNFSELPKYAAEETVRVIKFECQSSALHGSPPANSTCPPSYTSRLLSFGCENKIDSRVWWLHPDLKVQVTKRWESTYSIESTSRLQQEWGCMMNMQTRRKRWLWLDLIKSEEDKCWLTRMFLTYRTFLHSTGRHVQHTVHIL